MKGKVVKKGKEDTERKQKESRILKEDTLQRKSPFLGIARPQPQFQHVSDLYSPRIGLHISCSRIGRPIMGIYKSLTDA